MTISWQAVSLLILYLSTVRCMTVDFSMNKPFSLFQFSFLKVSHKQPNGIVCLTLNRQLFICLLLMMKRKNTHTHTAQKQCQQFYKTEVGINYNTLIHSKRSTVYTKQTQFNFNRWMKFSVKNLHIFILFKILEQTGWTQINEEKHFCL